MLTGGKLVNISTPDQNEEFENTTTSNSIQTQNLQLEELNFQPNSSTAPRVDSCNQDVGKKIDPALCEKCNAVFFYCERGICKDADASKSSIGGTKAEICNLANGSNFCKPPYATEGDGWYCV